MEERANEVSENNQRADSVSSLDENNQRAEDYLMGIIENRINLYRTRRKRYIRFQRIIAATKHLNAIRKRATLGQSVQRGQRMKVRKSSHELYSYRPKRTVSKDSVTTRDKEKFNDKGKIRRQWKKDHPGEY